MRTLLHNMDLVKENLNGIIESMDTEHQIDIRHIHTHTKEGGAFMDFYSVQHDAKTVAKLLTDYLMKTRQTSWFLRDPVRSHLVKSSTPFKHDLRLYPSNTIKIDLTPIPQRHANVGSSTLPPHDARQTSNSRSSTPNPSQPYPYPHEQPPPLQHMQVADEPVTVDELYAVLRPYGRIDELKIVAAGSGQGGTAAAAAASAAAAIGSSGGGAHAQQHAIATYHKVHGAIGAKNAAHGIRVGETTRLALNYMVAERQNAFAAFFRRFPALFIPVVLSLGGVALYSAFDPIRVYSIRNKITGMFSLL